MKKSSVLLLVTVIVVPLFCLAMAVAGIIVGLGVTSSVTARTQIDEAAIEAEILNIAADYVASGDVAAAQERLAALGIPNTSQYLSFMLDRFIQEQRGPQDADTHNLFQLADALGAASPSVIAALATPTPLPTETPTPTATITPLPTDAPPTDTPVPVPDQPTETPVPPTDTPAPPPTPGPPTNTPAPTDTPTPVPPAVDFRLVTQRMYSLEENGACRGMHQIFVTVIDAAGNPLDGVAVEDTFQAVPPHTSGEKGPGKLEYDLWKNGFALRVIKKQDGSPATSDVTAKLSSVDADIPNEWLVQGGYCESDADCSTRKSINQLCLGHYSYEVVFQRTY
jgi:hypothetical protein